MTNTNVMKRILFTLFIVVSALAVQAQVLQRAPENTQSSTTQTVQSSDVAYAYDFSRGLPDFTMYDVDNNPPFEIAEQVGFKQGDAWLALIYGSEYIAGSNSMHSNLGAAEDWLITPAIEVGEGHFLAFDMISISYLGTRVEGTFDVRLSTTGVDIEDFTVVLNEGLKAGTSWTRFGYDLSEYAGQTVHIAFINVSRSEDLLAIDNLFVGVPAVANIMPVYYRIQEDVSRGQTIQLLVVPDVLEPVTTVSATLTCGDFTTTKTETDLELNPNEYYLLTFDEPLPAPTAGVGQLFNITATINEKETLEVQGEIISQAYAPEKRFVFEEQTGTWCGHCVDAMYNVELMKEKYSDKVIPLSVHFGDIMGCDDYYAYTSMSMKNYAPVACAMRDGELINVDIEDLEMLYDFYIERPALADVKIAAEWVGEDKQSIRLTSTTTCAMSSTTFPMRLEYVVVENDVYMPDSKLYNQTNYSSDPSYDVGQWSNLPDPIPAGQINYDDVVRYVVSDKVGSGIVESLPLAIEKDVPYTHSVEIPVASNILNIANCEFIVLLLDVESGLILNAAKCSIPCEEVKAEQLQLVHNQSVMADDASLTFDEKGVIFLSALVTPYITTNKQVVWSSSDENVAVVASNGRVSPVGEGTTTITATTTDGTALSASCVVNCPAGVESVTTDGVVVMAQQGTITIANAEVGSDVAVYTVDGRAVYSSVAADTTVRIAHLEGGVYIVRVDGNSFKVRL